MNQTTRTLLIAFGVVLVVVIGIVIFSAFSLERNSPPRAELVDYFEERMTTLGVADIGQPIEGFDAHLLIRAFPGLIPQDFNGVETLEGRYRVEGNAIIFVRDETQPISSAERTLSNKGYATLLTTVSTRLGMGAHTAASIDVLIDRINTSDTIDAAIEEGGSARGIQVVPRSVLEDSRCPEDVTCIQAGTVRVRTLLTTKEGSGEQVFILGTPVATSTYLVTLMRVTPNARAGFVIDPSEYHFFFEVKDMQ